jgi:hypothetical protein
MNKAFSHPLERVMTETVTAAAKLFLSLFPLFDQIESQACGWGGGRP